MASVIRRVLAGTSAVALLIVGVQLIGESSASAHSNALAGVPACQADGTYQVTWTVTNDYDDPGAPNDVVTITDHAPGAATITPNTITLHRPSVGGAVGTMTETGIPGNSTSAMLDVLGTWTDGYTFDTGPVSVSLPGTCQPSHQPANVTYENGACVNNVVTEPSYTIPSDAGVTYSVNGTPAAANKYPVPNGGHFVVNATSTTLTLTGTTHWDFTLTVAPGNCGTTFATPEVPTVTQSRCVNHAPVAPTLVYAVTNGVTYSVDKQPPFTAGETVLVTATAGNNVKFDDTAPNWPAAWTELDATHATHSITFEQPLNCGSFATPTVPTVTQTRCVNHAPVAPTLDLPTTNGVTYSVDKAAPYTAGETVVVTALAGNLFTFDDTAANWPSGWTEVDTTHATDSITFQPPLNCGSSATPAVPTLTQTSCPAGRTTPLDPTLTLPDDTAQIHYTVKTISNSSNAAGFAADSVTTSYQPGQTVLVTATAQGTYFFSTVPSAWTKVSDTVLTYTAHFNALKPHECTLSEKAAKAGFTSSQCVEGTPKTGTYTVPSSTGVEYTANGKTVQAGTYPAAANTKVTIVATAKPGYTLVGETTWTQSFGSAPQCHNTAPVHVHRPSDTDHAQTSNNNLASTGVPTENLISIGFALLVIGALSMLLATRRRDEER